MTSFIRPVIFILGFILIFSSCHKDTYDPEALGRDYFIQNIPDNFDWSTTTSVAVEITPYDLYNGQYPYTIEIFDKNPLLDPAAALCAIGWGTAPKPLIKNITVPRTQTILYIRQTSPGGRKSIKEAAIEQGQLNCSFAPVAQTNISNQKLTSFNPPLQELTVDIPEGVIEISGTQQNTNLSPGKNYIIRTSYTGKITFPGYGAGCSLYITGTWNNTSELTILERNEKIYVLESGKLLAQTPCRLQFNAPDAPLYIAPGGQLGEEEKLFITLQFQNNGILQNEGTLYCDKITSERRGMKILNKGKCYANLLKSGDSYEFTNECYTNIKQVNMPSGSVLNIAPECSFTSEEISIVNSHINMDFSAMLQTEILRTANEGQNNFQGTGEKGEYALVQIGELICPDNHKPTVIFHKNIIVDCKTYPQNSHSYKILGIMQDPDSGPIIEIKPSECSQGNDYTPEKPVKPEFPQKIVFDSPYTFASEDNFPSPGDFDLNDLVVSLDSMTYYYIKNEEENAVSKMTLHLTIRAVGAARQLGAAIQFDQLEVNDIQSVSYSKDVPLSIFQRNGNGTENNPGYTVVPLFDNAHQMLGSNNTSLIINTISNYPQWINDATPNSFEVSIEFSSPVDVKDIELKELNYFVIVGTKRENRIEIHLPTYKHSGLSGTPAQQQVVTNEYMWTIQIPGIFLYPHEWEKITLAYPHFESWVQSNREQDEDWYLSPNTNYLYKKRS